MIDTMQETPGKHKDTITFNVDGKIVNVPLATIMDAVMQYSVEMIAQIEISDDRVAKDGIIWVRNALKVGGPLLLKMAGYKERIRPEKGDNILLWYMPRLLIKLLEPVARIPEIKVKADESI